MASRTACASSIYGCLRVAERILGPNRQWQGINPSQQSLLDFFAANDLDLVQAVRTGLITAEASYEREVLERFLANHGFAGMPVPEFTKPDFGVASVFDLLVHWLEVGKRITLSGQNQQQVPGVQLKKDIVTIQAVNGFHEPLVTVDTQEGFEVKLLKVGSVAGRRYESYLELLRAPQRLSVGLPISGYSCVRLPMIDFQQDVDLDWILGLNTMGDDGRPAIVRAASQRNRLRLNDRGARAQSATVMVVMRGVSIDRPYVIDEPFLLWVTQKYRPTPLFVAYLDYDSWQDPGNLD